MKRPSPPIHAPPAPVAVPAVAQQGAMIATVPAIKAASKQPALVPLRASPTPSEAVEVDYRSATQMQIVVYRKLCCT